MTEPKLGLDRAKTGRAKGTPNKVTAKLKDAIVQAAEQTGEDMNGKGGLIGYCVFLAKNEPKAFAGLMGRVIPLQVAGPDDADGEPTAIEMRIVRPRG